MSLSGLSAKLLRIAKMITALNDVDFNRFNALFNQTLQSMSVNVGELKKVTARTFADAAHWRVVEMAEDAGDELEDKDIMRIEKEAASFYGNEIAPILSKIDNFMRGRMWNIQQAKDITKDIETFYDHLGSSFMAEVGGIMHTVEDYFDAFRLSAASYTTSSAENIDNSGFADALGTLNAMLGQGIGIDMKNEYSDFSSALKSGIEELRAAQDEVSKGKSPDMWLDAVDRTIQHMKSKSSMSANESLFGLGFYNMMFNRLVGQNTRNEDLYDLNRWIRMYKRFDRLFAIIPSEINSMVNAISKFFNRHNGTESSGGGLSRDPKALYRDDAIDCYNSLQSSYINIVSALGDTIGDYGVKFNLDEEMAELKSALDKI